MAKKMDHSVMVVDLEGKPMVNGPGGPELSMKDLIVFTMVNIDPKEGAETKAKAFALTQKFFRGKKVNLTTDECSFIKATAGKAMGVLAYGRLCEWLEGDEPFMASEDEDDADNVDDATN